MQTLTRPDEHIFRYKIDIEMCALQALLIDMQLDQWQKEQQQQQHLHLPMDAICRKCDSNRE